MKTPFHCMVLDLSRSTEPRAPMPRRLLGIEVTDARLARACGLGNIDPQHGFGGGSGRAAIEAAIDWPLPPPEASLITLRADADALGAMAILRLRAEGVDLSSVIRARIAFIACHDAFENGDWTEWLAQRGPLPQPATASDVTTAPLAYRALTALAQDRSMVVDQRVESIRHWLKTGALPQAAVDAAWTYAATLAAAWNRESVHIEAYGQGRIALVRGDVPGGLQLAYRVAPVVFAETRSHGARKVTIAQFSPGWADFGALQRRLSELEPGWGGSATILGSPLAEGTRLATGEILVALEQALGHRSA